VKAQLQHVGTSRSPVITVDEATGNLAGWRDLAAALAPFPPSRTYYPGIRRIIGRDDAKASRCIDGLLRRLAPLIWAAFAFDGFDLMEASFSIVTAASATLLAPQRVPHFDSRDPNHLALMLYLSKTPGTAFFRQRSTGIEVIDAASQSRFIHAADRESAEMSGYIRGSNAHFEQIGAVAGVPDRLVMYQGCLLHSGIIPEDMDFSADPRRGRLTLNLFVQGSRG
jgi:hypothetical protein